MTAERSRLIRLSEVRERVPFGRSTLYLLMSQGDFPKPIHIGKRAVAWLESDITAWIENRLSAASANKAA